jgi:ATP-dependent exoDNAse (exonuclease V) beta subunit
VYEGGKVTWFDSGLLKLKPPKLTGTDREHLLKNTEERQKGRERYNSWQAQRTDLLEKGKTPKERLSAPADDSIRIERVPSPHGVRPGSRAFGKVVHALLEQGDAERGAPGYAKQFGLGAEHVSAAIQAARNALNHDILTTAATARQVHREMPITARAETGELIEGRIDLAFETDEGWTIVDYKTGRTDKQQLRNYARALSKATKRPVRAIALEI